MAASADIVIYTSPMCGYCHAAKDLLRRRGAAFHEIDVMADPERRREMTERSGGGRTVPQIFFGEHPIGGFTELHALDRSGALDQLLDPAT
ncbi:MAG TPA: glutaredoxin 3 [Aestuariivirgaceae bacterium]|nr:glutaredoxin 3 [Aestuariivirgaceae bacterium]